MDVNQKQAINAASMQAPDQCGRVTGREALASLIQRKERELAGLRALERALPLELPPAADEALYAIMIRVSSRG